MSIGLRLLPLAACCLAWGAFHVPQLPDYADGSGPSQWVEPPSAADGPDAANGADGELPDIGVLRTRPLFTPGRRPATGEPRSQAPAASADPAGENRQLSLGLPVVLGVAVSDGKAVAVLRSEAQLRRVTVGGKVGDWTVTMIDRTAVALQWAERRVSVPVTPPADNAASGPAVEPRDQSAPAVKWTIARRDEGFRLGL